MEIGLVLLFSGMEIGLVLLFSGMEIGKSTDIQWNGDGE
jgi:hypothetical protein